MPSDSQPAPRSANDAAVADEIAVTDLAVRGALPQALSGQYVGIGPKGIEAVSLRDGRAVSYRNRSITTETDFVATFLVPFANAVLAFGDGTLAYQLGAGLETVRAVDLAGARRSLTGQPTIDANTGELHLLTVATDPSQLHVSVSPGGLTRTIRSIDNAPGTIRQLALTRDHVVLLADGFVGIGPRTGVNATATWFAIDTGARDIACAYAHGESVIVHATGPSLERWTLDRRTTTLRCEVLAPTPHAFTSTNPASHRFLWTVGAGAMHKHDLLVGGRQSHPFDGDSKPEGLVFVADPERGSLDDGGWLVGFVHDETRNETDLVVLDAQEIERPAVATVRIPRRIPNGGHGTWVPTARI